MFKDEVVVQVDISDLSDDQRCIFQLLSHDLVNRLPAEATPPQVATFAVDSIIHHTARQFPLYPPDIARRDVALPVLKKYSAALSLFYDQGEGVN